MKTSKDRIIYLLKAYSEGSTTEEEERELFGWADEGDEGVFREYVEILLASPNPDGTPLPVDWEPLFNRILKEKNTRSNKTIIKPERWKWWAAASIFLLLTGAYYFFRAGENAAHLNVSASGSGKNEADISPPQTINALLTLSDGRQIVLDSTDEGILATQGAVKITKLPDGQITYQGNRGEVLYNTLLNPRGSKVVAIQLSDKTEVWLNAESSLKYPTVFSGKERKVEITGEAYFEVAPNRAKPFIVSRGDAQVIVLGTHFNINAYPDEESVNVTLLEGSIQVSSLGDNGSARKVQPGEQAQIRPDGHIGLKTRVDLDEIMAWKDNLFSFKGADMKSIMNQVSRWYNVDVTFEKEIKEKFYAEVSRNTNISTLLEMLEATRAVKFKIEKEKITVITE